MSQGNLLENKPLHWHLHELAQVVEILDSRRIPVNRATRDTRAGAIPYYGATGQVGWIDDYLFDEELILLGEDGAPFLQPRKPKAYLIKGKAWVNNHAHVLRAKEGIDARFIAHFLNILDYRPYVSGTTRLKLPQGPMRRIPILIPSLHEQRQIVAEIETQFARLDAAVAALKSARIRLKRYRASVLKAACEGRLVPTEAELAKREGREYEPASVLLERIQAERAASPNKKREKAKDTAALDVSELAVLPEGWAWTNMREILSLPLANGRSVKDGSGGFPVLRLTALRDNTVDLSKKKTGDWTEQEAFRFLVAESDFLIARGNGSLRLVGRGALVSSNPEKVAYPDTLIRARFVPDHIEARYIATIWKSHVVRAQIERQARTTAGIYKINQQDIGAISLLLPPLAEQERIVAEVERRMSVIEQMEALVEMNLKRAETLRQSILRMAFSGRLV